MRTLRYLLIVIGLVSFLSVSATAPQYGKTYQPAYGQSQYNPGGSYTQMPSINMQSTSVLQGSGSALPQAAVTGAYTAEGAQSGPRRAKQGDDDWEDDEWGETGDPWETPLGDVIIPLMLLALAYMSVRLFSKTRA